MVVSLLKFLVSQRSFWPKKSMRVLYINHFPKIFYKHRHICHIEWAFSPLPLGLADRANTISHEQRIFNSINGFVTACKTPKEDPSVGVSLEISFYSFSSNRHHSLPNSHMASSAKSSLASLFFSVKKMAVFYPELFYLLYF